MFETLCRAERIASALENTRSPLALYALLEEIVRLGEEDETLAAPLYETACGRLDEIEYEHQ